MCLFLQDRLVEKFIMRPEGGKNISAVEQPVQFSTRELDHFSVELPWPGESILLELLLPHDKAVSLPVEESYVVPLSIAEGEEMRAEDVEFEFFLNQDGEAPHLFAEVHDVATQVDLDVFDGPDHECLPRVSRRRRATSAESGVLLSSTSPPENRSRHAVPCEPGASVLRIAFTKREGLDADEPFARPVPWW